MVILFSVSLLISASLLFVVQPMVGKMLLPTLGGTPAVWNTCMVFFQAALLAGYAYAHGSIRLLGVRKQIVLHVLVLLAPLVVLPIGLAETRGPSVDDAPIIWLLTCLAYHVGLPFFVVSSSAPLLQRWFSATDHKDAADPYFLYAASNVGSLVSLLGYPLLIERVSTLDQQASAWSAGYVALVGMFIVCGAVLMIRTRHGLYHAAPTNVSNTATSIAWRQRLWWGLLAFVPSSLMLGVTTHITTDVAAVPLLWVIPLALYLTTFILVFAKRPPIPTALMARIMPLIVLPLVLLMFEELGMPWLLIIVHLAAFFVCSMVCHGQLADDRPAASHLTEFFLWMSIGGVLGGIFNAVIAPMIFDTIIEYPLVVVLACLVRRPSRSVGLPRLDDVAYPTALAITLAVIIAILSWSDTSVSRGVFAIVFGVPVVICVTARRRPVRFALCFAAVMTAIGIYIGGNAGDQIHVERNFYGVKRVLVDAERGYRMLVHGGTDHGRQRLEPDRAREPLSYYHETGPIGDVFKLMGTQKRKPPIAVIGLGVGSVAGYVQEGQSLTFFELDPAIERLARDEQYFTFLTHSPGDVDVVLGDGRLTLAREDDGFYGLILLDAFSGDAVPTHLISLEAIRMYLSKLADDGLIAFHISNRYFDLEPILARAAAELNLTCVRRLDARVSERLREAGKMGSHVVVLARHEDTTVQLRNQGHWQPVASAGIAPLWTDQYCDIFSVLR